MNDELKALEESAKATQEIAKTIGLIVEAGKNTCLFCLPLMLSII
jgi:hypothetical protein